MNKTLVKPLVVAIGATVIGSLSNLALSETARSPFGMTGLSDGYMVAFSSRKDEEAEGKCGEGKCGMEVMDSNKDGKLSQAEFVAHNAQDEAKFKTMDADSDGFVSQAEMDASKKAHEGSCGEGKAKRLLRRG